MFTITLAHLLSRAGRLTPHEAVAIVQTLAERPTGAPTIENVEVGSDGTASCISSAGKPSVLQMATLLDTLLPPDTRVPPALRYTIARGTGTVEAPPFASLIEFSTALRRFEAVERGQVIRNLLRRVVDDVHIASAAETLLGIRPALAEPAVVTPVPVVAETEPDISAFDPGAIETLQRTLFEAPPVSSGGWAALAAAVALFASAAGGYTFMTLQRAVSATPPALSSDRSPAGTMLPEHPLGTTGRETPPDPPSATPAPSKKPAAPPMRVLRAHRSRLLARILR